MRAIQVNVRDEVWEAVEKEAKRKGLPVDSLLIRIIEGAVLRGEKGSLAKSFMVADEFGRKGPRDWKREDLYDG